MSTKLQVKDDSYDILKVGEVTLIYDSSTSLKGRVDFNNPKNEWASSVCSIQAVPGTPYGAVQEVYATSGHTNSITIEARGNGFVNGHVIAVSYIIFIHS